MGRPKRNVLAAAEESLTPPDTLQANHSLARVVKPEGNNLYACELPNGKPITLELAQRFRNTIWIKRGGFVLAELYAADGQDVRAAGEIINVVRDEKLWRKQPYWCVVPP
jgi:probable RNA-binding protein EIF1AD